MVETVEMAEMAVMVEMVEMEETGAVVVMEEMSIFWLSFWKGKNLTVQSFLPLQMLFK